MKEIKELLEYLQDLKLLKDQGKPLNPDSVLALGIEPAIERAEKVQKRMSQAIQMFAEISDMADGIRKEGANG